MFSSYVHYNSIGKISKYLKGEYFRRLRDRKIGVSNS